MRDRAIPRDWRKARWLAVIGLCLAFACEAGPPSIVMGRDRCGFCLMGIAEERFAAALVTNTGKTYTFDSVECLAAFVEFNDEGAAAKSLWVTDYESPPRRLEAEHAFFLESEALHSPMGLGLAAFASAEARDARSAGVGRALDWSGVRQAVRARWPSGSPHGTSHEGAHGAGAASEAEGPASVASSGKLADAIRAAAPGGRVVVEPGVYRGETLIIDKPLELVGVGMPVLDGEGRRGLITIRADDVTIRGLVLRNVGTTNIDDRAAVRVENSRRCRIEDNRIEEGFFGIYLAKVDGCTIRGNRLTASHSSETNSGNGIHLWSSSHIEIEQNAIAGYRDGIYFEFVKDSRVTDNRSEHNLRYGLHFMFSDRCRYEENTFRSNKAGVAVMYTNGVEMVDNEFLNNWGSATFGLLLKDIRDSRIERNRFIENSVALYVEGSDRLSVQNNDFERNGWAVKVLANSERNRFAGNNFAGNTFDVATNSRQSYNTFEGNYWDAYRGPDLDRDGTGDIAHRPVRLFSILVERNEPSLILLRSFLVQLLDAAETVVPALTPETLMDAMPRMVAVTREARSGL
jgi:nitrous oxidase accessory protein